MAEKNGPSVLKSAGAMGIAVFLSRILGLVREQVFAAMFGASTATDAYQIAFRIPNLLRDLFAEGAMSAALVPTFIRVQKEEGEARLWWAFSLPSHWSLCMREPSGLFRESSNSRYP
jgi:putative peptidoglycan lipid II flippase